MLQSAIVVEMKFCYLESYTKISNLSLHKISNQKLNLYDVIKIIAEQQTTEIK